jgi:diguanylate cyclase
VVSLGHGLGMTVVAEGVEDDATLTLLAEIGCDIAQGYAIARPAPAEAFEAWLRERRAKVAAPVSSPV